MSEAIVQRCDQFYQALSDYLDGELDQLDRSYVEQHLALCPPCGTFLEQFRLVQESCDRLSREACPSLDALFAEVLAAWRQASGGDGR